MAQKLSELSIADLKAGLDLINQQKVERAAFLREENADVINDIGIRTYDQIQFDFSCELDRRILSFKRE